MPAAAAPTPSVRSSGAERTLAFGSDAPVASLDPREGLYAALARRDASGAPSDGWRPEERIGFADAVRAYTAGPAVAAGGTERSAALAPGRHADLVAWAFDRPRWSGATGMPRARDARCSPSSAARS